MMEFFDVFDDNLQPIGQASRLETHTKGLWHHTFQCWIFREVNGVNKFIVQRRHPNKEAFPNRLDKSSAGHLMAGETVQDGVREIEEELGLIVPFERLVSCGEFRQEHIEPHWKDREICHIFLLHHDQELSAYQLQKEEVTGIFEVEVDAFFALMDDYVQTIRVSGLQWNELDEIYEAVEFEASSADFTPQSEGYFELLQAGFDKIKKGSV
jgi:isopentenyldiphosphate isomerase